MILTTLRNLFHRPTITEAGSMLSAQARLSERERKRHKLNELRAGLGWPLIE